jgi:Peptidase family M28
MIHYVGESRSSLHSWRIDGMGRIAFRLMAAGVGLCVLATVAVASQPGVVISQKVEVDTYRHYHQDLLYTSLGDNRGFGPEHDLARANIVEVLTSFGLDVVLEPFVYNSTTYYNVVATQTGAVLPDEIYVVGAHFDSANNPGADDNGSGTALVMETARVLSQHLSSRTIKYVLFDREEQGLRGSRAFVAAHASENIVMAVTADMVGHDSGAYGMDIYSTSGSAGVANDVADSIAGYGNGLNTFMNVGSFSFSDHWAFESVGIPAFVIIERCFACNSFYHTQNDAFNVSTDYIDYEMVGDLVRSVVGYLVDTVEISLYGDGDFDADVDLSDFALMQRCLSGAAEEECYAFDFDRDGAVDLSDFEQFLTESTGPAH